MNIFTSATQLSETTCWRCSSMYNIWHCMYTFPYQWIWIMSIHNFTTGTEMITKHPCCSFNKHKYIQWKINNQNTYKGDYKFTPHHNYVLPFLNAYGAKIVAVATCIKRRVNVLKCDSHLIFHILKFKVSWNLTFKYCK